MRKRLEKAFPGPSSYVWLFNCFHVSAIRPNPFLASGTESGRYKRKDGSGESEKSPEKPKLCLGKKPKDATLRCGFGALSLPASTSVGIMRVKNVLDP